MCCHATGETSLTRSVPYLSPVFSLCANRLREECSVVIDESSWRPVGCTRELYGLNLFGALCKNPSFPCAAPSCSRNVPSFKPQVFRRDYWSAEKLVGSMK